MQVNVKPLLFATLALAFLPPCQAQKMGTAPPAISNSATATITTPIPPPSPTSTFTFRPGLVLVVNGTAAGTGFESFTVDWAPGLDATSGWSTTGITLTGGGATPITAGLLASWNTTSLTTAGYFTIRLTVNAGGAATTALTMVYCEPDLISGVWPQQLPLAPEIGASVMPAVNDDGSFRLVCDAGWPWIQRGGDLDVAAECPV
jgi:hypothetical protein